MFNLISLASEVLAEVILMLNLRQVLSLWLCGNNGLNWRLSKGQEVRKMEIKMNFTKTCPWPPVISQFDGLQSFQYDRRGCTINIDLTPQQLSILPRNLTKLSFFETRDVSAVQAFFRDFPGHFPNLRSLNLLYFAQSRPLEFTLPSTLDFLSLGTWAAPCGTLKLSELPPNLNEFKGVVQEIDGSEAAEGRRKFPKTFKRSNCSSNSTNRSVICFLRNLNRSLIIASRQPRALYLIGAHCRPFL